MKNKIVLILPCICILSACSTLTEPNAPTKEYIYPVNNPYEREMLATPNEEYTESKPLPTFVKTAEVPQRQVSAKNVDVAWVQQQNPGALTILVATEDQPLPVGMALTQTPKDQRSAALRYERNGHMQYSGVYGSYADQETAEQAMQKLPDELKNKAKIVSFSQMQGLNLQ